MTYPRVAVMSRDHQMRLRAVFMSARVLLVMGGWSLMPNLWRGKRSVSSMEMGRAGIGFEWPPILGRPRFPLFRIPAPGLRLSRDDSATLTRRRSDGFLPPLSATLSPISSIPVFSHNLQSSHSLFRLLSVYVSGVNSEPKCCEKRRNRRTENIRQQRKGRRKPSRGGLEAAECWDEEVDPVGLSRGVSLGSGVCSRVMGM